MSNQAALRDLKEKLDEHLRLRPRPQSRQCFPWGHERVEVTLQLSDHKSMKLQHDLHHGTRLCEVRCNVVRILLCEEHGSLAFRMGCCIGVSRWSQGEVPHDPMGLLFAKVLYPYLKSTFSLCNANCMQSDIELCMHQGEFQNEFYLF